MKIKLKKTHIQWGITAFLVIAASVCVFILASHLGSIFGAIKTMIGILMPIIYGAFIAYILNPVMKFIENIVVLGFICKKFDFHPSEKVRRFIRLGSVILSLLFMMACIYGLIALLVPQLVNSIINLTNSFPRYATNIREYLVKMFQNNPDLENSAVDALETVTANLQNWINNSFMPRLNEFMASFSSQIMDFLSVIKNFLIGSIISMYFLNGKEEFIARGKRFLYAVVGDPEFANNILRDLRYVNRTFGGFFLGKIIDSAIIGAICYICTSILKMPYALLVSVIVGITNIIPFFGPFIGAVPSALLIFLVSPIQCLYFIIFIIILQQLDGNLIGPKILSNSTGLSSFMVVVAILVGGGLFGFVGLIIGVPMFAVICQLITNAMNHLLEKNHMPQDVNDYKDMNHMDVDTRTPSHGRDRRQDPELFHYGIRGRRLADPDTDDEVLPAYTIKKSRIVADEDVFEEEPVIIAEDKFEQIQDVAADDVQEEISGNAKDTQEEE